MYNYFSKYELNFSRMSKKSVVKHTWSAKGSNVNS